MPFLDSGYMYSCKRKQPQTLVLSYGGRSPKITSVCLFVFSEQLNFKRKRNHRA